MRQATSLETPDANRVFAPRNRNGAAATALACATYAAIPYLGILFCPLALAFSVAGLARSCSRPQLGGRAESGGGIILSAVLFAYQFALWWLLYQIPKWAAGQQ
jgi:hypothetical protein